MSTAVNEKTMESTAARDDSLNSPSPEVVDDNKTRGKPWMYKSLSLGPLRIPGYASPQFQLAFVGVVCFLCPGMFNAIQGLGAAGQVSAYDINNASTALYSCFSVVGFFAGSIANRIGLRVTLGIGGFGYFLYVASILSYNHNQNAGFLIFAGALLGVCAGLLWCAQGAIMMSYPPERSKGRYVSWFWMIFNLGAVIGALIPLGQNIHVREQAKVNDGTYIAFLVLMAFGFLLSTMLCNPRFVERSDGSHVILMKHPTWKSEFIGLGQTFKSDPWILFLFPAFFASNWFYTYHFQDVNLPAFNLRTRALNNVLYWAMQILGAYVTGYLLDWSYLRRSIRARAAVGYLFVLTMVIWGGGLEFQRGYNRAEAESKPSTLHQFDWTESGYIGPMFLYMFYGYYDAAWQTTMYWFMGAMTNNGRKLAYFAGFYKGIQSAGAAVAPVLDAQKIPYINIFASNWGLLTGSLLIAAPVIWLKVKDTTSIEEDLAFSDETLKEVAATDTVLAQAEAEASEKY